MDDYVNVKAGSGMIQPPPMDPLDGLEVIVEGTFTVGVLKCVPSRRGIRRDGNMFDDRITVEGVSEEEFIVVKTAARAVEEEALGRTTMSSVADLDESATLEQIQAEAAKAVAEAEAAAAEAIRKAEKMEMLKKRAEEAMARRKQQKK
jgi:hypothetical protein